MKKIHYFSFSVFRPYQASKLAPTPASCEALPDALEALLPTSEALPASFAALLAAAEALLADSEPLPVDSEALPTVSNPHSAASAGFDNSGGEEGSADRVTLFETYSFFLEKLHAYHKDILVSRLRLVLADIEP